MPWAGLYRYWLFAKVTDTLRRAAHIPRETVPEVMPEVVLEPIAPEPHPWLLLEPWQCSTWNNPVNKERKTKFQTQTVMRLDLQTITAADWLLMRREGLLTEKNEKEAIEKAGLGEIPFDLWQLTISDLGELTSGALPERIRDYYADTTQTALQYIRRIAALRSFVNLLNELLEKTTPVAYGPDAGIKVGGLIGIEGALIAVRSYFGLRSFTEAGDVTLADWYLSRKDLYRQNEFHRLAYEKQKQRQKQQEFKNKYKHRK